LRILKQVNYLTALYDSILNNTYNIKNIIKILINIPRGGVMKTFIKRLAVSGVAAASTLGLSGGAVLAQTQTGTQTYQANLSALNDSGTTGTATVQIDGENVTVTIRTTSASPGLPHAQHIHIGGQNICPSPSADSDNDGFINSAEGQPSYGEVKVSLTTTTDTSANSALAVDRFPVASSDGTVTYQRTFQLESGVTTADLANGVIVQHGVSELFGDKTKYDGDKKSSLDDSLPLEATIPAACGKLTSAPVGGAGAGIGTTRGIENSAVIAIGAASLLAAGAIVYRQRTAAARR
jgi:hypothetical protein